MLDATYQSQRNDAIDPAPNRENNTAILKNDGDSSDSEEEIYADIFDDEYYADLLQNLRERFEDMGTDLIHSISCAAHGIPLVILASINKDEEYKSLLEKCRALSKKLRTPTYRALLIQQLLNLPKLDQLTRWNSTFDMVRFSCRGFFDL